MSIQFLLDSQRKLQKRLGYDFDKMTRQERAKYIKDMMFWADDELHECVHELPYSKDWSKKYDRMTEEELELQDQKSKEEYIDFLHFAFNIGLALGLNEKTILDMYIDKNQINYDRQDNGY